MHSCPYCGCPGVYLVDTAAAIGERVMKKVMIIQPMTGKTYEQLKTEWDKAYILKWAKSTSLKLGIILARLLK